MDITFTTQNTGTVSGIQKEILSDGTVVNTHDIKSKIKLINN